jgi:hypothetical protein
MSQPNNDDRFDVRILQNHLRDGVLTRKEVDAFLSKLPDDAEHATETETRFTERNNPSEDSNQG